MALTLRQWIDYVQTEYNAAYGSGCYVGYKLRSAGTQLQEGNPEAAGVALYEAGSEMYNFADEALSRYSHQLFRIIGALNWIEENWPTPVDPYVLTWQKICAVWVANDFEAKEWTIACIDRMRQLMWDKPFYIKWAAKPTEQRE